MITVVDVQGNTVSVDVDVSIEVENLQAVLEADFDVPPEHQLLQYNGQSLTNHQHSLATYGVKDGDLLVLIDKRSTNSGTTASSMSAQATPSLAEQARQELLASQPIQEELAKVRQSRC